MYHNQEVAFDRNSYWSQAIALQKNVLQNPRVLVVEDDPHWQWVISAALKSLNQRVVLHCVRSVKHAEQLLYQSSNYELIIADYQLEGNKNGIDFWKDCREKNKRIPFMVVSGITENEFKKKISGVLDQKIRAPLYLSKPFKVEVFRRVIMRNFSRLEAA